MRIGFLVCAVALSPLARAETIAVCFGHGCSSIAEATLDEHERAGIHELFSEGRDAARERDEIGSAIALFESIVGAKTGTAADRARTGLAWPGQMDCIDESTNSTTYLAFLARAGLLRWHFVGKPATRGWLLFGWPHTTAVIRDIATNRAFAVDSWFFDNGIPPVVIPLESWKRGWVPTAERLP
jgi:hypothetical protein